MRHAPGIGSAPAESKLRELLLPPPVAGLKMGALGTAVALTVAERETRAGFGEGRPGVGRSLKATQDSHPAEPHLLCSPMPASPRLSTAREGCCSTYRAGAPAVCPLRVAW